MVANRRLTCIVMFVNGAARSQTLGGNVSEVNPLNFTIF